MDQTKVIASRWLPTPGNVLFSILVVVFFVMTQNVWANAGGESNSPTEVTSAVANTASTLSYQGYLTDANGDPINGNRNFVFRVYATSSGGTAVWTESHNSVPVSEGLFNIVLGSKTSGGIPDTIWQTPIYLETAVNGQTLAPREAIQLGTASTALKSLTLPTVMQTGRATVTATETTPELAVTITFDPPFPSPPKLFLTPYYNYTNRVIALPGDPCTGTHCTIFFRWVDGGNWEPGWFQSLDWLAIAE